MGPTDHSVDNPFTARNPYATVDDDGVVILGWVNTTNDLHYNQNWQQTSSDEGRTWAAAQPANFGEYEGVLGGPGAAIVLGHHAPGSKYSGRIVGCGMTGWAAGLPHPLDATRAVAWFSDNHGINYTLSGGAAPFAGLQECQVVEFTNGSIMINARNHHLKSAGSNASCDCRAVSVSDDGGETWPPFWFAPQLIEPVCSAGLINMHGTLYFSNPAQKLKRSTMTLRRSQDSGESWETMSVIYAGCAAYSVLVPVDNGTIGVFYERGDPTLWSWDNMTYDKITLALVDISTANEGRRLNLKTDDALESPWWNRGGRQVSFWYWPGGCGCEGAMISFCTVIFSPYRSFPCK